MPTDTSGFEQSAHAILRATRQAIDEAAGEQIDFLVFLFDRDSGAVIHASSAKNHDETTEMSEDAKHYLELSSRADACRRAERWRDE